MVTTPTTAQGKPDGIGAARTAHYFSVPGVTNAYWEIPLIDAAFPDTLTTKLGASKTLPANGDIIGTGKNEAVRKGYVVPLRIKYSITVNGKTKKQAAMIVCSADKAKNVLADNLAGEKYWGSFNITEVGFRTRRVLVS